MSVEVTPPIDRPALTSTVVDGWRKVRMMRVMAAVLARDGSRGAGIVLEELLLRILGLLLLDDFVAPSIMLPPSS